jgi:hypothetical protein
VTLKEKSFEKIISDVSPQFAPIYNQALKAEQSGLDQICGPGYRKALEFLVKDYAKAKNNTDANKIESVQLGPCIQQYIDHASVKAIAERATWLGNDETHYIRRWETKDVHDLKALIDLTVHWISVDLLSAEVIKEMPDPKAAKTGN